jgi:hypothetical protein
MSDVTVQPVGVGDVTSRGRKGIGWLQGSRWGDCRTRTALVDVDRNCVVEVIQFEIRKQNFSGRILVVHIFEEIFVSFIDVTSWKANKSKKC